MYPEVPITPGRNARLLAKIEESHKNSRGTYASPAAEYLLNREFEEERANEAWVGDITYIWAARDWIEMARNHRDTLLNGIFHSDRGSQYASGAFQKALKEREIGPHGRSLSAPLQSLAAP